MALDEPDKTDLQMEVEGILFAIEDSVSSGYKTITIDYTNNWIRRGFSVSPYGVTYSE